MKLPSLIIAMACALAAQQTAPHPARRALVIGNNTYRKLPALQAPARDAAAVAAALADVGFDPQVKYNLDQAGLRAVTDQFVSTVKSGDAVFFYFSGYGMQADDLNWLLPVSFDPGDERPVSVQAYLLRRLIADLDARQAGPRFLVIDASRECPELAQKSSGDGLANAEPAARTLSSFSASPGRTTRDAAGNVVGPFAAALIAAIKTPGLVPVQVFSKATAAVVKSSGGKQTPYFIPSAVDDFYFVAPPPPPPPPVPKTNLERVIPVPEEPKPGTTRENPKDRLTYVYIPAGKFAMGCVPQDNCKPDENPRHTVAISKPFWMTQTEVTVSGYERFSNANGRRMPPPTKTNPKWMYTENPISRVNWEDAEKYCEWAGGRLPTEAEWEYAARGGKARQIYPWGDQFDPEQTNSFKKGTRNRRFDETMPARRYAENGFNLFDMIGNAREWVYDYYNPGFYAQSKGADPRDDNTAKERAVRGGSFYYAAKDLRISARDHADPVKEVSNQTGFRCVLPRVP